MRRAVDAVTATATTVSIIGLYGAPEAGPKRFAARRSWVGPKARNRKPKQAVG